jgi:hypothetical protein
MDIKDVNRTHENYHSAFILYVLPYFNIEPIKKRTDAPGPACTGKGHHKQI